jgi:hypothetical protein
LLSNVNLKGYVEMVSRCLPAFGVAMVVLGMACSSQEPVVERRGGPIPEPTPEMPGAAGSPSGVAGAPAGEAGSGGESSGGISFCAALEVARAKCQRCHSNPPENGAPVPFVTFEDFQAAYGSSGITYGEVAIRLVNEDIMPYVALNDPPTSLMPPVEPLTVDEKATLLSWLEQGAKPEGGTECP